MSIIPQLIANSLIAAAVYSMVTLGFNLIYRTAKFFDLGYGVLTAVGGYAVFYFSNTLGMNIYLSTLLGVFVAGFAGFAIEKLVYRRLRHKKASNMVFIVASLGVMTALQAIIAIFFSSQFQVFPIALGSQAYHLWGSYITGIQITTFVSSLVIMFSLALTLKFTKFGKAVRAVSDDSEVATIVGINTDSIISKVFLIGSAVAGLSGILVGFDTGLQPNMGFSLLLKAVIACIIGGVGNIYAGVLGALLLGFVENFGIWKISGEWKDAISFGVLIIFLLVRPSGLFGEQH